MSQKIVLFCILIIGLALTALQAQIEYNDADWGIHPMPYSRVGASGFQFLKLPTNARSAGLGGVQSVLSHGDATAAFTNPASTADVKNMDMAFSYMNWIADIKFQSISLVKNMNKWGVIGVNMVYLDYGDMIRTENMTGFDEAGNDLGVSPVFNGLGTFSANDLAIGVSYSRQITNKLQLGGNLRFIQEKLDDAVTTNWSLDIGTLYYTGLKTLRIAMMGKSFGPDAQFKEYRNRIEINPIRIKMPMMFVLGAAIDVIEANQEGDGRMILAAEMTHPNDGPEKVNLGLEYSFMGMFDLRAGYRFHYDEEGLTLGCGLRYKAFDTLLNINYAYLDAGALTQVHVFTLGVGL